MGFLPLLLFVSGFLILAFEVEKTTALLEQRSEKSLNLLNASTILLNCRALFALGIQPSLIQSLEQSQSEKLPDGRLQLSCKSTADNVVCQASLKWRRFGHTNVVFLSLH